MDSPLALDDQNRTVVVSEEGGGTQGHSCDQCLVQSLQFLGRVSVAAVIALAGVILVGWVFSAGPLADAAFRQTTTKPVSALSFVIAAVALLLRNPPEQNVRQRIGLVLSLVVVLVGVFTLCEYVFRWRTGIEQWLFTQDLAHAGNDLRARMAAGTAVALALLGLGIALLNVTTSRGWRPAEFLAFLPGLIGLLGLMDSIYDPRTSVLGIPLFTSIMLAVMAQALLLARPAEGLMEVASSYTLGGITARRLIPLAIVFSVALGWVRWKGEEAHLYESEFGVALFVTAIIVFFAVMVWRVARSLAHAELDRRRADAVWFRANQELSATFRQRIAELERTNQELEALRKAGGPSPPHP